MVEEAKPRVAALTLGCKVNQYDTEAVLESFEARGFEVVSPDQNADVYLINTCTVTNVADKKSRQLVRKIVREHPEAVVTVFGCYTQTQPEEVAKIPGVSLVVGTQNRSELAELVLEKLKEKGKGPQSLVRPFNKPDFEELVVSNFGEKVRAVLKIQEGCQQFCSYCKVPFARGPERSRAEAGVLETAQKLVAEGYEEIVLTGIHLAAYGKDLEPKSSLAEITRKVAEVTGLKRLRLSSVEPTDVTDELLELIAQHPVVCPHLHMPLQSGCDSVLKRMGRKYTTAEYRKVVERARELNPDLGLTTDVIVGFPAETPGEFAETVNFVREMGFSRLHVFPYSRRKGTPAARLPEQVPGSVKSQRSQELIKVGEELAEKFQTGFVGKSLPVLFEEVKEGLGEGYTENYIRVMASLEGISSKDLVGSIRPVLLRESANGGAYGSIVER